MWGNFAKGSNYGRILITLLEKLRKLLSGYVYWGHRGIKHPVCTVFRGQLKSNKRCTVLYT